VHSFAKSLNHSRNNSISLWLSKNSSTPIFHSWVCLDCVKWLSHWTTERLNDGMTDGKWIKTDMNESSHFWRSWESQLREDERRIWEVSIWNSKVLRKVKSRWSYVYFDEVWQRFEITVNVNLQIRKDLSVYWNWNEISAKLTSTISHKFHQTNQTDRYVSEMKEKFEVLRCKTHNFWGEARNGLDMFLWMGVDIIWR
jgi:hypothetical protein